MRERESGGFNITGRIVEKIAETPFLGEILVERVRRGVVQSQDLRYAELEILILKGFRWRMQRAIYGRPHG